MISLWIQSTTCVYLHVLLCIVCMLIYSIENVYPNAILPLNKPTLMISLAIVRAYVRVANMLIHHQANAWVQNSARLVYSPTGGIRSAWLCAMMAHLGI